MSFEERITQAEKDTEVVGWAIKPDNYSWTLVRKHVGKKGKSAGVLKERTVGWYKSLQSAQSALIDVFTAYRNGRRRHLPKSGSGAY